LRWLRQVLGLKWVNFTRAGKDFPTGTLFSDVNLGPTRTRNECHELP